MLRTSRRGEAAERGPGLVEPPDLLADDLRVREQARELLAAHQAVLLDDARAWSSSVQRPAQPTPRRCRIATRVSSGSQCQTGTRKCGSIGNQKFGVCTQ